MWAGLGWGGADPGLDGPGWGVWLSLYSEQTVQEGGPPSAHPAGPRLPPGAGTGPRPRVMGGLCRVQDWACLWKCLSLSIPLFLYSSLSLSSHFSLFYFQGLPLFVSENQFSLWCALFNVRLFLSTEPLSLCLYLNFPLSLLPHLPACLCTTSPRCQPFPVWCMAEV